MFGYPSISAVGESGTPGETGGGKAAPRQDSQKRRYCRTSRASFASGRDQVPRSHPFSGRERLQKVVSLGSPKCDRVQARRAVPPQHEGQEPCAEAATRVVEHDPAAFAGRAGGAPFLSVVCHVDTNNATRQRPGGAPFASSPRQVGGRKLVRTPYAVGREGRWPYDGSKVAGAHPQRRRSLAPTITCPAADDRHRHEPYRLPLRGSLGPRRWLEPPSTEPCAGSTPAASTFNPAACRLPRSSRPPRTRPGG